MITGTFTATGTSAVLTAQSTAKLSLSGFGSATVKLQRLIDGTNWRDVESFTSDTEALVDGYNSQFRLNCSVYASGTIAYAFG